MYIRICIYVYVYMYKFRYIPLSPMTFHYIGGFLKWGYPKMVFMEKPIKMDDLAVRTPISGNLHIHPYPTTSNHIPIISPYLPYPELLWISSLLNPGIGSALLCSRDRELGSVPATHMSQQNLRRTWDTPSVWMFPQFPTVIVWMSKICGNFFEIGANLECYIWINHTSRTRNKIGMIPMHNSSSDMAVNYQSIPPLWLRPAPNSDLC